MIKPKALRKGDTVGIVAPSGNFDKESFEKGIEAIEKMGFKTFWREDIFLRERYMAGDDKRRASELMEMFADERIKAIFSVRGGYGSGRILPLLKKQAIIDNPKIFVGYSDNSFLLNFFVQECSMVSFHGPMVAGDLARGLSPYEEDAFTRLLTSDKPLGELKIEGIEVLQRGKAEGMLTGGCLSIIISTMGTRYELDTREKILFLEDTNEPIYRLDRMLTQLRIAGKLERVKGIVFGNICGNRGEEDFKKMVAETFLNTKAPILYKLPAGHGDCSITLPFGIRIKIDANRIEFLEPAVSC